MSLRPSLRKRVSHQPTYMNDVMGSMANVGRSQFTRWSNGELASSSPMFTIGPHVSPPLAEFCTTSNPLFRSM